MEEFGSDLNPSEDRAMICGSIAMLNEFKEICIERGMEELEDLLTDDFAINETSIPD